MLSEKIDKILFAPGLTFFPTHKNALSMQYVDVLLPDISFVMESQFLAVERQ